MFLYNYLTTINQSLYAILPSHIVYLIFPASSHPINGELHDLE